MDLRTSAHKSKKSSKPTPTSSTKDKAVGNGVPEIEAAGVTPPAEKQKADAPAGASNVAEPSAQAAQPKAEKEAKPSISAVVRKLVCLNQTKSVDEISQLLIDGGWFAGDVEKRKSTISTLRVDALAILKIARECGLLKG